MVRAIVEAGRDDIALFTGNDDNIVLDLVTPYRFGDSQRRITGGLLGRAYPHRNDDTFVAQHLDQWLK